MQAALETMYSDLSFEQRLAKLDLTKVMSRVSRETGMEGETLARAEQLYRQFLTLLNRFPQKTFVPPVIVDHVWDSHVMHTRQYASDCELLFGSYRHHDPREDDTSAEYESITIPAYAAEFGVDILTARQIDPTHFSAAQCGA